jgi:hypothetical protein
MHAWKSDENGAAADLLVGDSGGGFEPWLARVACAQPLLYTFRTGY